jgi:hypothetical protein
VFRDIYTYFVKTRPTSAAPPSSPTGPVAPTLISFTGINAPVLNTNYQSSEAKEILSVIPIGNPDNPSEYKVKCAVYKTWIAKP